MSKVLVVYCSMTGNTKAAAEAIAAGAKGAGAKVTLKTGTEAQPQDLLDCDAVALGSYDAFSYMGGGLKDFLDRAFYPTQGAGHGQALRRVRHARRRGEGRPEHRIPRQDLQAQEGRPGRADHGKARRAGHRRPEGARRQARRRGRRVVTPTGRLSRIFPFAVWERGVYHCFSLG